MHQGPGECWILFQEARRKSYCNEAHIVIRRDDPSAQVVVPNHKVLDRGTLKGDHQASRFKHK
jgi:hypothetical protein